MNNYKHLTIGGSGGSTPSDIVEYLADARDVERATGYYSESGGAPSLWLGRGAEALGLGGPVNRDDLIPLLEGRLPDGTDLRGRGGRGGEHRAGTDIPHSCEKSFSMLALTSGDPRLMEIFQESLQVAAAAIEEKMVYARHGSGGTGGREYTSSAVIAAFIHESARTVDGRADPDLHGHLTILNMTQRSDETWSKLKLDFGERANLIKIADFAAKAYRARALQELGYRIRTTKDGYEIDGISRESIDTASRRTKQIDDDLAARGTSRSESTARERNDASLATRGSKACLGRDEQRWAWRKEARDLWGVDIDALTREARERESAGLAPVADLSSDAVRSATRHLSERETVMSRSDITLDALRAGMGHVLLESVQAEIATGTAGLLAAGEDDQGRPRYTTRDALYREQHTLARARAGRGKADALMTDDQVRDYISQREQSAGFTYSDGQRDAIALALTTRDTVSGVIGAAGAGKTTSMKEIVAAYRGAGHEVIGIAPSARARNELEIAGAEVNRTVASFLACEHDHNDRRLLILDEAGMVSARDMDALMRKLEQEGGRLLLVGDPRQLKAVEAGQPFAQLIETGAIASAAIDEIKRQTDLHLRAIAQSFARGDAAGATSRARDYMTAAPIVAADPAKPTTAERRAAIARATAEAYLSLPVGERARTLVLSGTNAVRQQTNARIREGLKKSGEVGKEDLKIEALDKSDMTREQRARAESYAAGMVVRFRSGRGGRGETRTTTDYSVTGTSGDRVTLRDAGGREKLWDPARERATRVYDPREINLSPGDAIIFRENQGRGDARIANGQTATIEHVERDTDGGAQVLARLDDGREIHLDPEQGHAIDYGWCRTVHAAQGATVANVIVAGESSRVATAETAYVACSRVGLSREAIARGERESLTIVTDNPARLQESWEKWADKQHALTAARDASRPAPAELQALRAEAREELGKEGDLSAAREARTDRERDTEPERSERDNASDGAAHAAARAEIEQAQGQLAATRAEIGKDRGRGIDR